MYLCAIQVVGTTCFIVRLFGPGVGMCSIDLSILDLQNTGMDELVDCVAMPGTNGRTIFQFAFLCPFKQVVHILDGKVYSLVLTTIFIGC